MNEVTFTVSTDSESGWLVASWDAPGGGGITTQAETPEKLFDEIRDAVLCYFDDHELPEEVKVHFQNDPSLSVLETAWSCPATFPARKPLRLSSVPGSRVSRRPE